LESSVVDNVAEEAAPTPPTEQRSYALSRPSIIAGLIGATALAALDGTIVATAMPTIVGQLGGLPLYPLVIAAYLLTATTTVPLYGKLSDMYGRKPVFIVGAAIVVVGSILCGLAWNMPSLIAFRAVQGLGAGAVLPVSLTLIGDLFSIEERARLQGVFGAVWGVSGVLGPLVGGLIVQFLSWPWVFYINVPVGIAAALLIYLNLREPTIHTRQRLDIAGAVTLTIGVGLLLAGLQLGGRGNWTSPLTLGSLAGAAALLALFAFVERRAAAPILSLDLLGRPVIAIPCLAGLLAGGVLIGIMAYVPLLVQGAWGGNPIEAGLIIGPLSLGWPLASSQTGKLLRNFSYHTLAFGGSTLVLMGSLLLLLILVPAVAQNAALRTIAVVVSTFIMGAGFGFSTSSMLIAVQNAVTWGERGIATASVQFFRNMGNTVGAAALGALLVAMLTPLLATPRVQDLLTRLPSTQLEGGDPTLGPVNVLLELDVRDTLDPALRSALAGALESSLGWVFVGITAMAVIAALLASRFPRIVPREEL
jgi:Na+/melibiose symporter-like transporter